MKQCREAEWEGDRNAAFPYLLHLINLFWPVGSAATEHRVWKQAVLTHTLVPWQQSLWLIMCYKIIHQKDLNVRMLTSRSGWPCCVRVQLSQFSQDLKPAGDWSTDFAAINAWFGFSSSAQALTSWKMDTAREQSCSDVAVLPLQAALWPGSGVFVL